MSLSGTASGRVLPAHDRTPGLARLARRAAVGVGALAIVFHIAHGQLGLGAPALNTFTESTLYDAVVSAAALSCLVRGVLIRRERLAWLALGLGLSFNAAGEVYYTIAWGDSGTPPIPSVADLLYLLCYPAAYAGLVLLARARIERINASAWLDGMIAATTLAAVISSIAFAPILHSVSHASAIALATTMAYPVGDMVLLGIVACAFALSGWRPGRAWLLLGLGFGVWAVADTAYTYANATGTYTSGGVLDSLWLVAAYLVGCAAWQPVRRISPTWVKRRRLLAIPAAWALAALGVLIYAGLNDDGALGVWLAGTALLLVIVRGGWTFQENMRLLEASEQDAVTDALTGLGNRRLMQARLERALADGPASPPGVFVMFDLDGFKAYNDRFGHLAGDTLLAHLGARLREAVGEAGRVYRPGGDEFCVLFDSDLANVDVRTAAAVAALTAEGEGFSVTTSHGAVSLPLEAHTPTQALREADDRMYACKGLRRGSACQQTHDALLGLLRERQPQLHQHLCEVGRLAWEIGTRMGLNAEQLDELRRAAELHDIGKAAIPDAILHKPSALNDHEWTFMRRHTIIGERVLAAAPALAPVAVLVRSSHERWDGCGYPDGLAGSDIPLGARIVFVCDAFDAMTSERPYCPRRTPGEALTELRVHAGSQFDPEIVTLFEQTWQELSGAPTEPDGAVSNGPVSNGLAGNGLASPDSALALPAEPGSASALDGPG
jgi:two-component system, cell cycle response regulator